MRRLLPIFIVFLVAGCGGDDNGPESSPAGSSSGAATAAVPADTPVVIEISADLESDQWQSALTFAGRLDPADRDLADTLSAELFDGEVAYEDVEPWLGDGLAFGLSGVEDGEPAGVLAIETTDEEAARETISREGEGDKPVTYKGVDYTVEDTGSASGVFDGMVVGTSDETTFKAAVDASQGESMADDTTYQEALAEAPEDHLVTAYADVDGLLALLADSGAVPQETLDTVRETPGFQGGSAVVATLVAEEDAMTFDAVGTGDAPAPEGPSVADLPGGAWFALAAGGEQFGQGILQGLEQSGGNEATQIADELGLTAFLGGLENVTLRLGGTSIGELEGAFELIGSDADAASAIVQRAARELRVLGAPVKVEGDQVTLSIPPAKLLRMEADGGTLRVSAGEQPESTLDEDEAFGEATDKLDLDRVSLFTDFAPLQELLSTLPADPDLEEAQKVLAELGYLIAGSGEDDGALHGRFVLTLR